MDLAATVEAAATMLNLRPGAGTTRLESTTNFVAVGRAGLVRVEATPPMVLLRDGGDHREQPI